MEMKQRKAFCVVAQEMHVTRAAEGLKIAQPALTQQIRALERSCGFAFCFEQKGAELSSLKLVSTSTRAWRTIAVNRRMTSPLASLSRPPLKTLTSKPTIGVSPGLPSMKTRSRSYSFM